MKKYTLFILLLILSVASFAQEEEDYQKFVVEGKIWNCELYNYFVPEDNYQLKYYIKGDTTINQLEYKKMYSFNQDKNGQTLYMMALREKDKKVFKIEDKSTNEELLYDFSLKVGDKVLEKSAEYSINYIVYLVDTITIQDKSYRCICLKENYLSTACVVWIEGIGGGGWPLDPYILSYMGPRCYLTSCTLNGTELMNKDEIESLVDDMNSKVMDVIRTVRADKESKNVPTYDLQGREVKGPLKAGIYLRDGKKISVK